MSFFFLDAQVAKRPVFAAALCSVAGLEIKKDKLAYATHTLYMPDRLPTFQA
jgi:hypothetical protein